MKEMLVGDLYRDKPSFKVTEEFLCETCEIAKSKHRNPTNTNASKSTDLLSLVHTDLCGPMSTPSLGGARFFMAVTDDYSRFTITYFLKHKSEALERFLEYFAHAQRITGKQLKVIRTDNGGEL